MGELSSGELEAIYGEEVAAELPATVDRAAVRRIQLVAKLLDESIRIPGTEYRIGLDPIVGMVPVAGDVVSAGISLYIVVEAARLGVSYTTIVRMLANVTVDTVGGAIPYVGDVFDAVWKANKWNLVMVIEEIADTHPPEEAPEPVTIEVTSA